MLDVLQDMFFLVLLVVGFASSFSATLVYHRKHRKELKTVQGVVTTTAMSAAAKAVDRPVPKAKQEMSKTERAAFAAGRKDVVEGWVNWTKYPTATEQEQEAERRRKMSETEEGRQKLTAMDALAKHRRSSWDSTYLYSYHSGSNREEKSQELLSRVPTSGWSLSQLREHLNDVAIYARIEDTPNPGAQTRKRLVAAMITDRLDEPFDPSQAEVTAQYAYHDNHQVQARYLEGRAKGTEDIMDAITSARTRTREIGSASNAIAAANKRHAAALAALRETNQPTAARDQHADYEAQVRAIEATTED